MSQKQIHRANKKLRNQVKKVIPAIVWYNVTTKRIRKFPWSWFNFVFPLYPRPSRVKEWARDVKEWVRVVFKKKEDKK